jgi:hypothetical protein
MSQGWKKIQATLLARARAEKKAVLRNQGLKRVHNGQKREGPALFRVGTVDTAGHSGSVDPVDLKKPRT